jgi:hypothetical protein
MDLEFFILKPHAIVEVKRLWWKHASSGCSTGAMRHVPFSCCQSCPFLVTNVKIANELAHKKLSS